MEDSVIRTLRRCKSLAYLKYIKFDGSSWLPIQPCCAETCILCHPGLLSPIFSFVLLHSTHYYSCVELFSASLGLSLSLCLPGLSFVLFRWILLITIIHVLSCSRPPLASHCLCVELLLAYRSHVGRGWALSVVWSFREAPPGLYWRYGTALGHWSYFPWRD